MKIQSELAGGEHLQRVLSELPRKLRMTITAKVVRAGIKPVLSGARARVPVDSGDLKRSLTSKVKRYPNRGSAVAIIGPSSREPAAWYSHLAHDGHLNADGSFTPGNPFLRLAFDAGKAEASRRMADKLSKELIAAVRI